MERLTRLIGIGLLMSVVATSIGYYQRTVDAITSEPTEVAAPGDDESASGFDGEAMGWRGDESNSPPPRYLSFTGGIPSGLYAIDDPAAGRGRAVQDRAVRDRAVPDRDVTAGRSPASDYPAETDIVPHASLADRGLLAPGLYATSFGVRDCSYEIRRIDKSRTEAVIGEDRLREGRMLVSINEIEPDVFVSVPQCGDWSRWSPLVEPLTVAGDGDYWVGDLAAGTWSVPIGCMWEKVVGFRGAELFDVQDSGIGPRPLVVEEDTLGVRVRGCRSPLTLDER